MYGLNVERRRLNGKPLSWDLTAHLYKRSLQGKVAVVTDKPLNMLASVRKQWLRRIRRAQIERARTLKATHAFELSQQLAYMQRLRFVAKPPEDILEADVTFATADDCVKFAPDCHTMYVTYSFPKEKLHMMTSWMPRHGVVVIYE